MAKPAGAWQEDHLGSEEEDLCSRACNRGCTSASKQPQVWTKMLKKREGKACNGIRVHGIFNLQQRVIASYVAATHKHYICNVH